MASVERGRGNQLPGSARRGHRGCCVGIGEGGEVALLVVRPRVRGVVEYRGEVLDVGEGSAVRDSDQIELPVVPTQPHTTRSSL